MRASKPKTRYDEQLDGEFAWEWVEFWKEDNEEWRPVPADVKVPFWRTTHWSKNYARSAVERLKDHTPFLKPA